MILIKMHKLGSVEVLYAIRFRSLLFVILILFLLLSAVVTDIPLSIPLQPPPVQFHRPSPSESPLDDRLRNPHCKKKRSVHSV